jgi:hypothetical protein
LGGGGVHHQHSLLNVFMSWSDSGSPTAARMLMSLQRFEGAGLLATASLGTSGAAAAAAAAAAVGCGLGLALGRALATGAGFGLGSASSAFSVGGVGASCGTLTERQGVLHGFASAAACARGPYSATSVATTAIATRGEERAG